MKGLSGLLYINGADVFGTYGVFLYTDKRKDKPNYSALLTPPKMKPYTAVAFREENGEKLPETLTPAFEPRDVSLQFAMVANSKAEFFSNYKKFVALLASGWLEIRIPELDKTYKMYYLSCSEYTQLTTLTAGQVAGQFKVKLHEPQPSIE